MGFWSDLFRQGGEAVKQEARDAYARKGQNAHIDAQNSTGQDLANIQSSYIAGLISNTVAQREIGETAAAFVSFANSLGYERARRGASEISALANQMIANLQRDAGGTTGVGYTVPAEAIGIGTIAMLGLAAYLLLRKR